jgi:hypothetical protein
MGVIVPQAIDLRPIESPIVHDLPKVAAVGPSGKRDVPSSSQSSFAWDFSAKSAELP